MRLLVVMRSYPFPPRVGSAVVAYNTIRELSKKHSVFVLCLDFPKTQGDLAKFVEGIEFVRPKAAQKLLRFFHYAFYMFFKIPILISERLSHDIQRHVRELAQRNNYDAILLFEISAIRYCPIACYHKMIVNIEDPQSIKLLRQRELSVWYFWKKLKLSLYAYLVERYEKSIFPTLAKILVLSEADAKDLCEQGQYDNIGYVSYGITRRSDEDIFDYNNRTKGIVVFSGNMFHPPNVDGALNFINYAFPIVLQHYPTATLWIVGAEPDARIYKAARHFDKHVVITGKVDDMSEYLRCAIVAICPVRLKIGVQTKILEALSWGTPVVTTSAGNSGIGAQSGSELWVEDESVMFANRVVSLLRGENWHRLSFHGRRLVQERFSWEHSVSELEKHIGHIQIQKAAN
jgi:glycosyltransferase involved in cell wall biosynthesis